MFSRSSKLPLLNPEVKEAEEEGKAQRISLLTEISCHSHVYVLMKPKPKRRTDRPTDVTSTDFTHSVDQSLLVLHFLSFIDVE